MTTEFTTDEVCGTALFIKESWWALAVRGIIALVFGLAAVFWPDFVWGALYLIFGIFAVLTGIVLVVGAVVNRRYSNDWWIILVMGILALLVALLMFMHPGPVTRVVVLLIGLWALLSGLFDVIAGFSLRKEMEGEWLLILAGLISMLVGVYVLFNLDSGAEVIMLVVGIYNILAGLLILITAYTARNWSDKVLEAG